MIYFLIIILGLALGSFIAALSWRYPRGMSIAEGRSICPKCKKQIAGYDNIPLLSYLLLGGKCRNCKKHISIRYPLIELSTGVGFLFIYTIFPANISGLLFSLTIFLILLTILIIDFEHQIIPDLFIFLGIAAVLMQLFLTDSRLIFSSVFAGLLSAFLLLLIHLATRGRGMGLGDVKFAVLGGMLTGLRLNIIWLFLAFLTGASAGIILILGKKAGLKDKIAFGPFLVVAVPGALIWGEKIISLLLLR